MRDKINKGILMVILLVMTTIALAGRDPISVAITQALPTSSTVNQAYTIQYTLTNNLPFAVSGLSFNLSSTGTFVQTSNTCDATISSNASCSWQGSFTPTNAGSNSATTRLSYANVEVPLVQTTTATGGASGVNVVAVGQDLTTNGMVIYTSTDNGNTWSAATILPGAVGDREVALSSVAYGDGEWVAVGADTTNHTPVILNSSNGNDWAECSPTSTDNIELNSVSYGAGKWITVGRDSTSGAPVIYTSTDGLSWSRVALGLTDTINLYSVFYGDSKWIAVGVNGSVSGGAAFMTESTDSGERWSTVDTLSTIGSGVALQGVYYADGNWVVVGENGTTNSGFIATSLDLSDWTTSSAPDGVNRLLGVSYGSGAWVAVGVGATGLRTIITSNNASTWTAIDSSSLPQLTLNAVSYAASQFIVVGKYKTSNQYIATSADASNWVDRTLPSGANANLLGVGSSGG